MTNQDKADALLRAAVALRVAADAARTVADLPLSETDDELALEIRHWATRAANDARAALDDLREPLGRLLSDPDAPRH